MATANLEYGVQSEDGTRVRRAEIPFVVIDATDEGDARAAVAAEAPSNYNNCLIDGITINEVGPGVFRGVVRYAFSGDVTDLGMSEMEFTTSGATIHISHSRETKAAFDGSGNKLDSSPYGGAINLQTDDNGHNSVLGVDIVIPQLEWDETHLKTADEVTPAYIHDLYATTGKTNKYQWRFAAAGEALFLGASGRQKGNGYVELSYRWQLSANADSVMINGITFNGINESGHDYLWTHSKRTPDGGEVLDGVFVERVYDEADFAVLNVGTTNEGWGFSFDFSNPPFTISG